MARFWISWYQPGEDYRPITFPPPKQILGWWCSGYSEDAAILCAMVEAKNEDDARNAILQKDAWPDAGEQRFCESRNEDYKPSDRFPLSDWMIPRFEKNA